VKKIASILIVLLIFVLASVNSASAQTAGELQLGLNRDFGMSGFGDNIQGLFTLKIKSPPANLTRVEFFLDSKSMGEDTQAPFSLQFNTDSYALGQHTFSAVGYTADGQEMNSNPITAVFVTAGEGGNLALKIVIPIVGLLILAMVVSYAIPTILNKGKISSLPLGATRNYGIGGGVICPKCGRPFPLRLWMFHLGFSRIDRCPFCGKWSFVRQASLTDLRAAEAAELARAQPETTISGEPEADKLKKELDDSRFQNM